MPTLSPRTCACRVSYERGTPVDSVSYERGTPIDSGGGFKASLRVRLTAVAADADPVAPHLTDSQTVNTLRVNASTCRHPHCQTVDCRAVRQSGSQTGRQSGRQSESGEGVLEGEVDGRGCRCRPCRPAPGQGFRVEGIHIVGKSRMSLNFFKGRHFRTFPLKGPTPSSSRAWCRIHGIWYMVYGIWYMVYGIWYMVMGSG